MNAEFYYGYLMAGKKYFEWSALLLCWSSIKYYFSPAIVNMLL